MDRLHRPCPVCGGRDRFYLVRQPRNGGPPFWKCRRCGYREYTGLPVLPCPASARLSEQDRRTLQRIMVAASEQLTSEQLAMATEAQQYLRRRGVDDATQRHLIAHRVLGFVPYAWIDAWKRTEYDARILLGDSESEAQHAARSVLRLGFGRATNVPSIVFGYWKKNQVCAIRGRRIPPYDRTVRYWSQSISTALPLFAPAPDVWSCATVGLTEGELKAIVAYVAWKRSVIPFPFLAIPGATVRNPEWLESLRGRHVVLAFDADANGAGQRAQRELGDLLVSFGIKTSHIHLPLGAGQKKNDLDAFLLPHLHSKGSEI